MKRILCVIFAMLAAAAALAGLYFMNFSFSDIIRNLKPAVKLTGITSFRYSYTSGSYAFSGQIYSANLEDGIVTITMTLDGSNQEYVFETDPEFMDQLTELANEYHLSKWDGYHKSNQYVLDGSGFYLGFETESGQTVSASGYMSYPKNYQEVTDQLEAPFKEIFETMIPIRINLPEE